MDIEITKQYKDSLIPFSRELLEPLDLPQETLRFLTETGLPIGSKYEITPNAPLTFSSRPVVKQYPHFQHKYLQIASLGEMGELSIDLHFQSLHQIQITEDCGYELAISYLVNDSVGQFVDCLGAWLSFYPQLREEVGKQLEVDPAFRLFDHEEMYQPIMKRFKEIDPRAMREKKFFWRRMCEPDIV